MNNSENKIEKHYMFNNVKVFLKGEYEGFNLFMDEDNESLYITNAYNEVIVIVDADCNQNFGFMCIRGQEE